MKMELKDRPKVLMSDLQKGKKVPSIVYEEWFEHFKKWLEWLLESEPTGKTQGILRIHNCEKALGGCSLDCESCMLKDLVELILTRV